MDKTKQPIGVFDSGVGGLTVLKALKEVLPHESFVYLGDTARLPYGSKSKHTVIEYALQGGKLLHEHQVKCMVVACNTASSVAIDALSQYFKDTPILGVVEPGAQACVKQVRSGKVLVLATESTTRWHAYYHAISRINPNINVEELACPLFVALAEEGWTEGRLVQDIVQEVLKPSLHQDLDCVVLGCTHFPMLKQPIAACFANVPIIDSATSVAEAVKQRLSRAGLLNLNQSAGQTQFLATDSIERFKSMASKFMQIDMTADQVILQSDVPTRENSNQSGVGT